VPRAFDSANPSAQPFALELAYARNLDGQAIAERSHDEIARLKIGNEAQRTRWLADMSALFPDVKAASDSPASTGRAAERASTWTAATSAKSPIRSSAALFRDLARPRTSAPQLRASLLRSLN